MAGEDEAYTAWLCRQRCAAPGAPYGCGGDVVPHHDRQGVGIGLRGHDHRAVPLCWHHHQELHSLSGAFRAFTRASMRVWMERLIFESRARYEGRDKGNVQPMECPF